MTTLARGENTALSAKQLTAEVAGVTPGSVDLMVFQVTSAGTVRTDDDLVFFNQPRSPEGAVRLTGVSSVAIDITLVPNDIHMLRLAVSLDDSVSGSLATIPGLGVTCGSVLLPAVGFTTERAAVLAEIYRRGDQWKLRNVSAGWDQGLPALVTQHGVTVDDVAAAAAPPPPAPPAPVAPPAPPPPAPPAPPVAPPVQLNKITLTKASPTISLNKEQTNGAMRVNLNWDQGRKALSGGGAVDLDLACFYELRSSRWKGANAGKGVVQALGGIFGDFHKPPYISLDGDDRSGSQTGGENLHINLAHLDDIKRILVFAYIYEGTPNWAAANAVVTLYPAAGPQVEVRLDSPDNSARSCVIAVLENQGGGLVVNREERYFEGVQSDISNAYGWGFSFTQAQK